MTFVYTRRESFVMPMNITEFCSNCPPRIFSLPPLVLRES
jgi:hypothetical protein